MTPPACPVCGASAWKDSVVIWDGLAEEWGLSPAERAYVDRQQGTACSACGTSLRSAALAQAVCRTYPSIGTFRQLPRQHPRLRILEINEAGTLTPELRHWRRHTLASYPDVDMQKLPYADKSFDLVVHSDTLEHVPDPIAALQECRRVLRRRGILAYTVPVIVGKLSRQRPADAPSYHGAEALDQYLVHTEYGADFWTHPAEAGFTDIRIDIFEYPAATAVVCRR